jgi:valyl-tRNA synthetase
LDLVHGASFTEMVKKTLPGAPEAEAMAKFKKAYPSAASMGTGFPAFGADAVRFTLSTFPPSARRIALAPKRIEGYRHFLNKVWNATRLSLDLLGDYRQPSAMPPTPKDPINRWVLAKLGRAAKIAKGGMDTFRVDEAANELYRFFWYDFCDWYLELAKSMLRDGKADASETRATLAHVLDASLRLLHPLVPFLSEELWQRLPRSYAAEKSIALARYPLMEDYVDDDVAARAIADLQALIGGPRQVRTEYRISPAQPIEVRYQDEPRVRASIDTYGWAITALVRTSAIELVPPTGGALGDGFSANVVTNDHGLTVTFGVGLKGLIDPAKERDRIERELGRNDKELTAVKKTLASPGFAERAAPEAVAQKHADERRLTEERVRLQASLELVSKL